MLRNGMAVRTAVALVLAAVAFGQCGPRDNSLGETEFTCPDGTRYIFMEYLNNPSWQEAQDEAIARGGFLPNQVENTACISPQVSGERYWVGIRDPDLPPENVRGFEYTEGPRNGIAVSATDSRWCSGEPNDCCGGENCVVANWIAGSDCWNDFPCAGSFLDGSPAPACAHGLIEFPVGGCFQEPVYTGSEGVNCVPDGAPQRSDPGATCQAGCPQPGFTLQGAETTLTCTVPAGAMEGTWEGPTPTCVPVQCAVDTDVSTTNNAAGATVEFQTQVDYACAGGYGAPLDGSRSRTCQADAQLDGLPFRCTICPENTFAAPGSEACSACADGFISQPGSTECEPACPLPFAHEWLETLYEPVLDTEDSGFLKYGRSKDILSISFDNPNGYLFQSASIGSASEVTADHGDAPEDVAGNAPAPVGPYTNPKQCYTRYEVYSVWGDVEPSCSSAVNGNWLEYTCKLAIENQEPLDPIRNVNLDRTVISNIPFIVRFPRQVATSVSGLSAFQPPDVLAAIVRQEVVVNVNALTDLLAQIKLYTSVQWPFRLTTPQSTVTPTDIGTNSFALDTQCPDANAGDVANPAVDDSNACGQIWLLDLDVANGAAGAPCELDGDYQVKFEAECQPSWPSDCPLVQDDQGVLLNEFVVDFRIDSEYFCPRVVEEVDLAASLAVYKDFGHSIAATNFILGQTAYFVATSSSNKVTIVKTEVNTISIEPLGATGPVLVYDVSGGAACEAADNGDTGAVNGLAVQDGPCENAGQATEAWWNFLVDPTSVPNVPTDGSRDFSVSVVLDIEFKNAGGLLMERKVTLLQQGVGSSAQQAGAQADFKITDDDNTTSGAVGPSAVLGLVAAVAAVCM